jgi:hypothetical protein
LEEKRGVLAGTPRNQNPPVTVSQIRQEKQVRARLKLKVAFSVMLFHTLLDFFKMWVHINQIAVCSILEYSDAQNIP